MNVASSRQDLQEADVARIGRGQLQCLRQQHGARTAYQPNLLCVLQGWDGTQGTHDGVMACIDALLQVQVILQRRAGRQVRGCVV